MSAREIMAGLRALPVLDAVTPETLRAESVRGMRPGTARTTVILRTTEGFAVYRVADGARLSRPRRGVANVLSDREAISLGMVLVAC